MVDALPLLNAFLVGLIIGGYWYVQRARIEMRDLRDQATLVRDECKLLTKTIGEAHNSLATKVLELADKQKGLELKQAQKAFGAVR